MSNTENNTPFGSPPRAVRNTPPSAPRAPERGLVPDAPGDTIERGQPRSNANSDRLTPQAVAAMEEEVMMLAAAAAAAINAAGTQASSED